MSDKNSLLDEKLEESAKKPEKPELSGLEAEFAKFVDVDVSAIDPLNSLEITKENGPPNTKGIEEEADELLKKVIAESEAIEQKIISEKAEEKEEEIIPIPAPAKLPRDPKPAVSKPTVKEMEMLNTVPEDSNTREMDFKEHMPNESELAKLSMQDEISPSDHKESYMNNTEDHSYGDNIVNMPPRKAEKQESKSNFSNGGKVGRDNVALELSGEINMGLHCKFGGREIYLRFEEGILIISMNDGSEFRIPIKGAVDSKAA